MFHRYIEMFDIYSLCLINDRSRVHSELRSKLLTGFRLLWGGTFDLTPAQRVWAGSKKNNNKKPNLYVSLIDSDFLF